MMCTYFIHIIVASVWLTELTQYMEYVLYVAKRFKKMYRHKLPN